MGNALKSEFVMIPVSQIYPHPDNPRKDVGDISELAESIKANGILQNLTVVPGHYLSKNEYLKIAKAEGIPKDTARYSYDPKEWFAEDGYTVIIGHRRLAASKVAGLEEVPCVVSEMSLDEQVATMLTENMQRADLTVYEQAKAFQQLSIDFGMTVSEISEMSGFSETTVRRRTKLADLDEKAFKKACDRGATLFDFAELDKLENLDDRQKVLADMGTANFRNALKIALEAQKDRKRREAWIDQLNQFATRIEKQSYVDGKFLEMNYFRGYGPWSKNEDITKPEDADSVRYFYTVSDNQISMYKEAVHDLEADADALRRKQKEQEETAKWNQMQEIMRRHRELRKEFIVGYAQSKKHLHVILQYAPDAMLLEVERNYYSNLNTASLASMLGITFDEDNRCINQTELTQMKSDQPERVLLVFMYWYMEKSGGYASHDWDSQIHAWKITHTDNKRLDRLYQFLSDLGYEISDEERQIADGTHSLYYKEANNES